MPTFLDESGSTRTGPSGHGFFRVAAVWVPVETTELFRERVAEWKHARGLAPELIIKFHDTERHPETREQFFRLGLGAGMRFTACHIDLTQPALLRASQELIHWHALTGVATALRSVYLTEEFKAGRPLKESVTIDRCTDGNYLAVARHAFAGLLARRGVKRSMAAVPRFQDDKSDALLQLVDLVCGAVGSHIEARHGNPAGDSTWYKMFRTRGLSGDDRYGPGISVV